MPLTLPRNTAALVNRVPVSERNAVLQLDKYSVGGEQTEQKDALFAVCQTVRDEALLRALLGRREQILSKLPAATSFRCRTTGPLTLHLSRASALENAGICLHPLYGFAYLPGSGLKGMAHAYACEVWLPTQTDRDAGWQTICRVFGTAPSPWLNALAHRLHVAATPDPNAGAVVFHDAWPTEWPKLIVDIVNNHHPAYYQAEANDNAHPPGDWENPVPVYFLAVPVGVEFDFALSKRRADVDEDMLRLAREWLAGALCHLGAGAKTAAGYGTFASDQSIACAPLLQRLVKLDLITPAFLGGPDRHAQQSPRLPGIKAWLRQWWRAWNGHLSVTQLRQREAAIFGSIDLGTKLRVLHPRQFQQLELLARDQDYGSGGSALGYLGYGPVAYEKPKKGNRTQIDALAPNQTMHFRLAHSDRPALDEVLKSLWLASALGGVGSRSRRGWGSLLLARGETVSGLPDLRSAQTRDEYRDALFYGLDTIAPLAARRKAEDLSWTALSQETRIVLSVKPFSSWRGAMEDLGNKLIAFRSRDKRGDPKAEPGPDYHKTKAQLRGELPDDTTLPERAAFGMPYAQAFSSLPKVHSRRSPTATFTPIWTENDRTVEGRRASPLFCKVVRLGGGDFIWQVAFLPSQALPAGATVRGERTDVQPTEPLPHSSFASPGALGVLRAGRGPKLTLLKDFLDWLEGKPIASATTHPDTRSSTAAPKSRTHPASSKIPPPKPVNQGQTRQGTLRRHGETWVATFEGDDREATIVNVGKVPDAAENGQVAEFYITGASKRGGIQARFEKLKKVP